MSMGFLVGLAHHGKHPEGQTINRILGQEIELKSKEKMRPFFGRCRPSPFLTTDPSF
jgi:hypothetical protein